MPAGTDPFLEEQISQPHGRSTGEREQHPVDYVQQRRTLFRPPPRDKHNAVCARGTAVATSRSYRKRVSISGLSSSTSWSHVGQYHLASTGLPQAECRGA